MNDEIFTAYYDSPIGPLEIRYEQDAILSVFPVDVCLEQVVQPLSEHFVQELDAYFSGTSHTFSTPIRLIGTQFQREVWDALLNIPYGSTVSYQDVANAIKRPKAVRAVAHAISMNPILIVIPCHRVIGKNGRLTGFRAGIERKKFLLALEKEH